MRIWNKVNWMRKKFKAMNNNNPVYEIRYIPEPGGDATSIFLRCREIETLRVLLIALLQTEGCHALTVYKLPNYE